MTYAEVPARSASGQGFASSSAAAAAAAAAAAGLYRNLRL